MITQVIYPDKTTQLITYGTDKKVSQLIDRRGCLEKVTAKNSSQISVERSCAKKISKNTFALQATQKKDTSTKRDSLGRVALKFQGSSLVKYLYMENEAQPLQAGVFAAKNKKLIKKFGFAYDAKGRLSVVTSGDLKMQAAYDDSGNLAQLKTFKNKILIEDKNLMVRAPATTAKPVSTRYFLKWMEAVSLLGAR
jgi:hypothetical protein